MKIRLLYLGVVTISSIAVVYLLFILSEDIVHYRNNFIRRFPQHTAREKIDTINLVYNSFYFAGAENGNIYLGNRTAPLLVTVIDSSFKHISNYRINLDSTNSGFRAPHLKIRGNNFFLYEGLVPVVYSGNTKDWQANYKFKGGNLFSLMTPMDSDRLAMRYIKPGNGENLLGNADLKNTDKRTYGEGLLKRQFDGIFDTDGTLNYDPLLERLIYTYFYRNEYIVVKPNMELDYVGNTIDTTTKAKIKLVNKGAMMKTFQEPPLMVNKATFVAKGLLYVNSMLPGLHEPKSLWKHASIIDVYDLKDQSYRSSFPVYHLGKKKLTDFIVKDDRLYVIIEDILMCYQLDERIMSRTTLE